MQLYSLKGPKHHCSEVQCFVCVCVPTFRFSSSNNVRPVFFLINGLKMVEVKLLNYSKKLLRQRSYNDLVFLNLHLKMEMMET